MGSSWQAVLKCNSGNPGLAITLTYSNDCFQNGCTKILKSEAIEGDQSRRLPTLYACTSTTRFIPSCPFVLFDPCKTNPSYLLVVHSHIFSWLSAAGRLWPSGLVALWLHINTITIIIMAPSKTIRHHVAVAASTIQ